MVFFFYGILGCKARGDNLRVHFKLTHEAAVALKGMTLVRAKKYLNNVLNHKEIIPFRRYRYGVSRHAQVHAFHVLLYFFKIFYSMSLKVAGLPSLANICWIY